MFGYSHLCYVREWGIPSIRYWVSVVYDDNLAMVVPPSYQAPIEGCASVISQPWAHTMSLRNMGDISFLLAFCQCPSHAKYAVATDNTITSMSAISLSNSISASSLGTTAWP